MLRASHYVLCILAGTAALAACPALAADKLVLKDEVYVKGPKVLLGDVAKIEGENAEALALLEISPAANPGDTKQLNAALVATRIDAAGFDAQTIQIEGAPKVKATTLHLEVSPAQVSESLRDFILAKMPWDAKGALVDVQAPAATYRVPDGDLQIEWTPAPQYRYVGQGAFRGTISVDGTVQKTMLVKANVDATVPVVIARRDIQRGAIVSPIDLELQPTSVALAPAGALVEISEAAGMIAKKGIFAGQTVTTRHLDAPIVIKRNQLVNVELNSNGVFIQSRARAMTDARAGDLVLCTNPGSKEQFQGLVRPDGVVMVE